MKKVRNIILGIIAAGMLTVAVPVGGISAYASSAKISFSDPSATVGQEFSVNVKISSQDGNLGASDVVLSYDPSVIEFVSGNNASGGAGSVRLVGTMDSSSTKAFSYTLKFKAVQAGNTSISVGSYEVYDSDAQAVTVSKPGAATVKVKAPASSSGEAALSSLKISPGKLSPAFSPDVTAYTVQVGASVDKLAVSASAKDSKAKVLVSGDSGLKVGANTVVCKVTAENGQTTKSYTITVNKLDTVDVPSDAETEAETEAEAVETSSVVTNGLDVEIDGVSYTVATEFDASLLPEGYTQSTCTYGGSEVQCGSGNDLTLLYLQSADGNGAFYIYMPESGALSPYVTIDVTAKSILVLPPDASVQIPDGFVETTIQLNGTYKVQGWVWKSDEQQQYCVVYGMNESGEKSLYRYDIAEKTFQRYFEDPSLATKYDDAQVEEIVDQYNALCKDYNIRFIMIAVLGVACVILFFIVINLLLKRKEWKEEAQAAGGRQRAKCRSSAANVQPVANVRAERRTERASQPNRRERTTETGAVARTKRTPEERHSSGEREDSIPERRRREVDQRSSDARETRVSQDGERRAERDRRELTEEGRSERRRRELTEEGRSERRCRELAEKGRAERSQREPIEEGRTERRRREPIEEGRAERSRRESIEEGRSERSRRESIEEERSERSRREPAEETRSDRRHRALVGEDRSEGIRRDTADGSRAGHDRRTVTEESRAEKERTGTAKESRTRRDYASSSARRAAKESAASEERRNMRPTIQVRPASRSELYYTLDREEYGDRPTRYESESERSRRAREAKARLERDRRDADGFEYIDDPQ